MIDENMNDITKVRNLNKYSFKHELSVFIWIIRFQKIKIKHFKIREPLNDAKEIEFVYDMKIENSIENAVAQFNTNVR